MNVCVCVCVCVCSSAGVLEVSLAVAVIRHDSGILISRTVPVSSLPLSSLPLICLIASQLECVLSTLLNTAVIQVNRDAFKLTVLLNAHKCFSAVNSGPCGRRPSAQQCLQDVSSVSEMHILSTSNSRWNPN